MDVPKSHDKKVPTQEQKRNLEASDKAKAAIGNVLFGGKIGDNYTLGDFFPPYKTMVNQPILSQTMRNSLGLMVRKGFMTASINGELIDADSLTRNGNIRANTISFYQTKDSEYINDVWSTELFPNSIDKDLENAPAIKDLKVFDKENDSQIQKNKIKSLTVPEGYIAMYRGIKGNYQPAKFNKEVSDKLELLYNKIVNKAIEGKEQFSPQELQQFKAMNKTMNTQRVQSYTDNLDLAYGYAFGDDQSQGQLIRILLKRSSVGDGKSGIQFQYSGMTPEGYGTNVTIPRHIENEFEESKKNKTDQ